mmetsp:Transcript_16281/g.44844  ORF Transcript_16281/g.44844 Transcript_16281/m.44844 type:complete len:227 (-) Transcript_16281:63-743(-)
MPQVCAPRRLGVALDFDLVRTPAPAFLDARKQVGRQYRATRQNAENMILSQGFPNDYDDERWRGHGFPGHVQFVSFVGAQPLRPGVKFERDIQMSTMPRENTRPLNVTQMGNYVERFLSAPSSEEDQRRAHGEAVASLRALRGVAEEAERRENPHSYCRREVEQSRLRQQRLEEQARALQGLRSAGLSSINPRLGTSSSLPDFKQLRGRAGNDTWRSSTPWAIDEP